MDETFPAVILHPSLPKGKVGGRLRLTDERIEVVEPPLEGALEFSMPMRGIEVYLGGAGNRYLFFKSPHDDELRFYVNRDTGILKAMEKLKDPKIEAFLALNKRKQYIHWATWSGVVAIIMMILVGLYMNRRVMTNKLVDMIPYQLEVKAGDKILEALFPGGKKLSDKTVLDELRTMLAPLSEPIEKKGPFRFKIHILNDSTVNAFALPGAHIAFNSGLLMKAKTAEEVLGVAAHEMAHVTQRHVAKSLLRGIGVFLLAQTLLGDYTGIIAILVDNASFLMNQSFSREHEEEADRIGLRRLLEAGISPMGMVEFFRGLIEKDQTQNPHPQTQTSPEDSGEMDSMLSFLSSHPQTKERIRWVEESYRRWLEEEGRKEPMPVKFDYDQFKQKLSHALKKAQP